MDHSAMILVNFNQKTMGKADKFSQCYRSLSRARYAFLFPLLDILARNALRMRGLRENLLPMMPPIP